MERRAKALQLFRNLLDLDEGERDEFLARECGEDAALRAEIESLIECDRTRVDAFDDEEIDSRSGPSNVAVEVPESIGEYRVVRIIGFGGMGIVYEALQETPRRRVALKVVQPHVVDAGVRARFAREVELLGRLQHANIAQVYGAGSFDGGGIELPYFVMEFVDGVELDTWADRVDVTREKKLALFADLCSAVHYAHERGIVHRDLKPDNVLVAADGTFKILDFGIARTTNSDVKATEVGTTVGQLIGTLPYMSPEQAGGDVDSIDARSDIYTLGVLLQRILTGELPYAVAGRSIPDAIRVIQQEEPTRASSSDTTLRGDVDTIVRRALEKDPERRFQSAGAFADDIRRHLRHEPIESRPPSAVYQLHKFVRRNRGLAAGLAATILARVIGFAVSLSLFFDAREAQLVSDREAKKAIAIRDYLLVDMLKSASPWGAGIDVRVADLLDVAEPRVAATFVGHPETAVAVRHALGSAYANVGKTKRALEVLGAALAESESLHGKAHVETQSVRYSYAKQLASSARFDEARQHYQELQRTGYPPEGVDGEVAQESIALAIGHMRLKAGDSSALDDVRQTFEAAKVKYGEADRRVGRMRRTVIDSLLEQRALEEAEAVTREHLRHVEATSRIESPVEADRVQASMLLARIVFLRGRYDEGRQLFEELLDSIGKVFGRESLTAVTGLASYASMLSDIGDLARAEKAFEDAVTGLRRHVGAKHRYTLQVRNNQAIVLRKKGDLDQAEALVRAVLADRREALGYEDPDVAQSLDVLGVIERARGDFEGARRTLEESDRISTKALGADHYRTLDVRYNLASVYEKLDDFARAEKVYRGLVEPTERVYGKHHPYVADELFHIARMCRARGQPQEGIASARRALEIRRNILPDWHWHPHDAECVLGLLLVECGEEEEGEKMLLAAMRGFERVGKIERAVTGAVFSTLIRLYEKHGRRADADRIRTALAKAEAK